MESYSNRLDGHPCAKIIWWNGQNGRKRSLIPLWLFWRLVDTFMILVVLSIVIGFGPCVVASSLLASGGPAPNTLELLRDQSHPSHPPPPKRRIPKTFHPRRSMRSSPLSPTSAPVITCPSTSFSWMPCPAGWGIGCRDCGSLRFTMPAEGKGEARSSRKCFCRSRVFNLVGCVRVTVVCLGFDGCFLLCWFEEDGGFL